MKEIGEEREEREGCHERERECDRVGAGEREREKERARERRGTQVRPLNVESKREEESKRDENRGDRGGKRGK